jgi:hypothetical protein
MPANGQCDVLCRRVAVKEHTVPLDPQLALGYLVSPSVYVRAIVRQGYDVTDFDLIFVVVEHEVPQSGLVLAYPVHQ